MLDSTIADFAIPATGNTVFRLAEQRGKTVILYFYPKDSTPGCTTEAQQFRDLHAQFVDAGCVIAGISRDSLRSHENFKAKQELPFALLSDTQEQLCAQFGVIKEKKLYGKVYMGIVRSSFLIDEQGRLEQVWYKISPKDTPAKLLEALGQ